MFELNFDELKIWKEMKKILFVSAAALILWACSSEETAPVEEETIEEDVEATTTGRISIFPVFTKVSDETFEDGDQIGVTITKTGASSYYVWNKCLTYSASDGTFTGEVEWYSGTTTCTIVAYYPYQSGNVSTTGYPTSCSVATDQSEGISSSDFVMGTAEEVSPSSEAVSIEFNHLLSRINVKVSTGTTISSVKLSGSIISGVVNSSTGKASVGSGSTSEITLYPATDNELYQAILVPQTATLTLSLTTTGGTTVEKELSSKTLEGGYEYDLNVSYPYINGYKYVDLGLSSGLLWATYNVGAENSLESYYGNYYAWGETETKTTYSTSTVGSTYDNSSFSSSSNDISGNSTYDAATYNWGAPWRMPTYSEFSELIDGLDSWSFTSVDDVKGTLGTASNGNTIYFPAAGFALNSGTSSAGSGGFYYSSTPYSSTKAYYFNVNSSKVKQVLYSYVRAYGMTIRPVANAGIYDD